MAERDKNRSCSPPVPGPSGSATVTTEVVRREERERNPHTVESLAEVFRSVSPVCLSYVMMTFTLKGLILTLIIIIRFIDFL